MTDDQKKLIEELQYWIQWTATQQPGNETEVLFTHMQMGAIIINLN